MYALRLLGSIRLEGPAGPLSGRATQRRQLGLLSLLAAAGRDGSSRDKLATYLWPEASPETAGHSLADAVYHLRKALGDDAIEGRSTTLRLNLAVVRVDLVDFETALELGDFAGAVALYRGPFLDGFHLKVSSEFQHWRDAVAQRLERKLQTALEALADRATAQGDPTAAEGWLERLFALDPFNSRTVLRLMEARAAAGDPANAVKLASAHGEFLARELGVDLPTEVRALQEQLRAAEILSTPESRVAWQGGGPADVHGGRPYDASTGVESAVSHRQGVICVLVLPFANRSVDPEQEYLADGLSEEIIADLSRIRALRVISRNSAMLLKGTLKSTRVIAGEVGASHVLSGSLRRDGDALRIVVELVDAATDSPVWADKYVGTVADLLEVQKRVATAVVDALRVDLRPNESRWMQDRPIADVRAYECFLRARQEMWRFDPNGLQRALTLLEAALSIAGDNALLHATRGFAFLQHVNSMTRTDDEPLRLAEASAERCLALAPEMPQGHVVRGMAAWFRGDWRDAYRRVRKGMARGWRDPETLIWATCIYAYGGQLAAARETAAQLRAIDPLAAVGHVVTGLSPFMIGRFEYAHEHMAKAHEADPNVMVSTFYASTLRHLGRVEEAIGVLRATPAVLFQEWMTSMMLAGWERRPRDVHELARSSYAVWARNLGIWSLWTAESHALVGDDAGALDWLENAVGKGLLYPPFFAQHDRLLESLRGTPPFAALVAHATREWEDFTLEVSAVGHQYEEGE